MVGTQHLHKALTRWSESLQKKCWQHRLHVQQQQQYHPYPPHTTTTLQHHYHHYPQHCYLPVRVAFEGCKSAFNATNSMRVSLFFGTAEPNVFVGMRSMDDIASLQRRPTATTTSTDVVDGQKETTTGYDRLGDGSGSGDKEGPGARGDSGLAQFAPSMSDLLQLLQTKGCSWPATLPAGKGSKGPKPFLCVECYVEGAQDINTVHLFSGGAGNNAATDGSAAATAAVSTIVIGDENKGVSLTALEHARTMAALGHRKDMQDVCPTHNNSQQERQQEEELQQQPSSTCSSPPVLPSSGIVYIPQYGTISSLNVVTCAAIVLFYCHLDCNRVEARAAALQKKKGAGKSNSSAIRCSRGGFRPLLSTSLPPSTTTTTTTPIDASCHTAFGKKENNDRGSYQHFFEANLPTKQPMDEALHKETPAEFQARKSCKAAQDMAISRKNHLLKQQQQQEKKEKQKGQATHTQNPSANSEWRMDERPIHPIFYDCKTPEEIRKKHQALFCGPSSPSPASADVNADASAAELSQTGATPLSPSSASSQTSPFFRLSVLYENDIDRRNLGGLIRNANAFFCDSVFYCGSKHINRKGAVGSDKYVVNVEYLGRMRNDKNELCHEIQMARVAEKMQQVLWERRWQLWWLTCHQEHLHGEEEAGRGGEGFGGDSCCANGSSSPTSVLLPSVALDDSEESLLEHMFTMRGNGDAEEPMSEKKRREGPGVGTCASSSSSSSSSSSPSSASSCRGVVLLVPQEGLRPHPLLLRLCSKKLLIKRDFGDEKEKEEEEEVGGEEGRRRRRTQEGRLKSPHHCGLPSQAASGIALQRLFTVANWERLRAMQR